jgi:hypothetical protein
MIAPMYSFGARIVARMYGSRPRRSCRVGHVARVVDLDLLAVGPASPRRRRSARRDQVEVELALEPLAHDLHVQQAEEAAAEAEAERLEVSGS